MLLKPENMGGATACGGVSSPVVPIKKNPPLSYSQLYNLVVDSFSEARKSDSRLVQLVITGGDEYGPIMLSDLSVDARLAGVSICLSSGHRERENGGFEISLDYFLGKDIFE